MKNDDPNGEGTWHSKNLLKFTPTLLEASMGRVFHHIQNSSVGVISAYRDDNSESQNTEAHRNLMSDIHDVRKKHGFGYMLTHGGYIENKGQSNEKVVHERGVMLIADKKDHEKLGKELELLGRKHNQDSVLHVTGNQAKLIGTKNDPDAWVGYGQHKPVGSFHPRQIAQYFTHLRGWKTKTRNKRFSFAEEVQETFINEETGSAVEPYGYFVNARSFFTRAEHLYW